jgi:hypothetical protein
MKKSDLKKIIKPLVKECIHEVLIEEGVLSNIVSEVAVGMRTDMLTEDRCPQPPPVKQGQNTLPNKQKANETKRKLMEAINKDAYNGVNLFEGTQPMTSYEASPTPQGSTDLGHPSDSGVDISALMGDASKIWQAMK